MAVRLMEERITTWETVWSHHKHPPAEFYSEDDYCLSVQLRLYGDTHRKRVAELIKITDETATAWFRGNGRSSKRKLIVLRRK